jgi:DNA-binding response OmpR family regulator
MPVERLAFGSFRLNPENGTLLRDGELAPIGQKGALILGALLKSPGEVLTKAQLMDAAWPGMAVEESNLSVQIASLRKALRARAGRRRMDRDGSARGLSAIRRRPGREFPARATGLAGACPSFNRRLAI